MCLTPTTRVSLLKQAGVIARHASEGLTLTDVLEMIDKLIAGFVTAEFQSKIWAAYRETRGKPEMWRKAQAAVCTTVQYPVIAWYGFEANFDGSLRSAQAVFSQVRAHPDIYRRVHLMIYLIHPGYQRQVAAGWSPGPEDCLPGRPGAPGCTRSVRGKVFVVVGGDRGHAEGIAVRVGSSPASARMEGRLAKGAIIEEVDRFDDRLAYEIIVGDGPVAGWIRVSFEGRPLLDPPIR